MHTTDLRARLLKLHELLLRERDCCKAVDLDGLNRVVAEKEQLLTDLNDVEATAAPELHELAAKIKVENRRNAYLQWATLRFIRESMTFFNRQTSQSSYGAGGRMQNYTASGMLLSGRV